MNPSEERYQNWLAGRGYVLTADVSDERLAKEGLTRDRLTQLYREALARNGANAQPLPRVDEL